VDVGADDFGDAPREEVPDDDASVVAAHGQQGAPAVEGAGEGHTDTVQSAICLLENIHNKPKISSQRVFISPGALTFPQSKDETSGVLKDEDEDEELVTCLWVVLPERFYERNIKTQSDEKLLTRQSSIHAGCTSVPVVQMFCVVQHMG